MADQVGTYVGLKVLSPTKEQLYETCINSGVPVLKDMFSERLHVTVIYSRKKCEGLLLDATKIYTAYPDGYEIFAGLKGENILVLKLKCPEITELHNEMMRSKGATHDYPYFKPHITLNYNFSDRSAMGINPFKGPILLGEIYEEDLDLNWGR
jgi:hypothetical protein